MTRLITTLAALTFLVLLLPGIAAATQAAIGPLLSLLLLLVIARLVASPRRGL